MTQRHDPQPAAQQGARAGVVANAADPLLTLLLTVGASLLAAGAETERVEDSVTRLGAAYGEARTECFAVSSGVFVSLGNGRATGFRRVVNRGIDLGRLTEWNDLSRRLAAVRPAWEEADAWVHALEERTSGYPRWTGLLMAGVGNGAFAYLLGARPAEVALAFLAGVLVQAGFPAAARGFTPRFFHTAVGGLLAVLVAVAGARIWPGTVRPGVVVTGAIVLLVPGISLTAAVRDLLTGDFLAAGARTLEALVMAGALAFGVSLGSQSFGHVLTLSALLTGTGAAPPFGWPTLLAAAVAAGSYGLMRNAPVRVLGACAVAGALAFGATGLLGATTGATLPVFVGGAAVSAVAEAAAHRLRVPAITVLAPGILPLVPGFLAYHGVLGFADGAYRTGVQDTILTLFWAGAVAMGIAAVSLAVRSVPHRERDSATSP